MDLKTRANIAALWRMVPEIRSDIYVKEDLCEIQVFVGIPDQERIRRQIGGVLEQLAAKSGCLGFDFFPVLARSLKTEATRKKLKDTRRFIPTDQEKSVENPLPT